MTLSKAEDYDKYSLLKVKLVKQNDMHPTPLIVVMDALKDDEGNLHHYSYCIQTSEYHALMQNRFPAQGNMSLPFADIKQKLYLLVHQEQTVELSLDEIQTVYSSDSTYVGVVRKVKCIANALQGVINYGKR